MLERDTHTLKSFEKSFVERYGYVKRKYPSGPMRQIEAPEVQALRLLLHDLPYWSRVWVVQELSFAPQVTLMCDDMELEWASISRLLLKEPYFDAFHSLNNGHGGRLYDGNEHFLNMFTRVKIIEDQRRAMHDHDAESFRNLLDILTRFRDKEAADPKDKIYGLLGLAGQSHDIKVNYEKPLGSIFQEVTLSLINNSGNLDVICQNPFEQRDGPRALRSEHNLADTSTSADIESIPSWAVHFGPSRSQDPSILFAQRDIFKAGIHRMTQSCQVVGKTRTY